MYDPLAEEAEASDMLSTEQKEFLTKYFVPDFIEGGGETTSRT